jgi:hypothetical protein
VIAGPAPILPRTTEIEIVVMMVLGRDSLRWLLRRERARFQPQRIAVDGVFERAAQATVVIVLDCHEAKGLQHAVGQRPRGAENFGHAVHRTRLCLESDLNKIACAKGLLQAQQASGYGDSLEFSFRTAAIFKTNRSQNRVSKLDPGGAPRGVRLGEMGHRPYALSHYAILRNRLRRPLVRIPRPRREFGGSNSIVMQRLSGDLLSS